MPKEKTQEKRKTYTLHLYASPSEMNEIHTKLKEGDSGTDGKIRGGDTTRKVMLEWARKK